ncbi:sensor histidine kinase [Pedobacter montanisoli]|uniref:histidine kinase n=1 Tax=Pedobacter montanisoli TaxID=2923277 RepID=A0ABS9ZSQ3_9SPHI|nr:HAMP domain-containing sensor histidine kinase [Pedobacter montanisoli]MCJ0741528.1 HAMP domain-containing histidine kinase [Pedobacter montanisoli]
MYKETFFLLFAHEVKDILSGLGNYLYLLNNQGLNSKENLLMLQQLENEFKDHETYIHELLFWAKQKRADFNHSEKDINLKQLTECIIQNHDIINMSFHKNIRFQNHISDLVLKLDQTLYTIVLKNVIRNALKFSEANSSIHLKATLINNEVISYVCDSGTGINLNKPTDIAIPFSTSSSQHRTGSGLALSLCKELLKTEGGEIWAVNNQDKGITVFFSLPIYQ